MNKHWLFALISLSILLQSLTINAKPGSGLEINEPEKLYVVYTIEPDHIDKSPLEAIINNSLSNTVIELEQRDDAQLFLRVEQHAGQYLLYLDFSRKVHYLAAGECFSKGAFVWGRYVKDITDITDLHEDVQLLMDEFITEYTQANDL